MYMSAYIIDYALCNYDFVLCMSKFNNKKGFFDVKLRPLL